jgi:hypothetical protein
MLREARWDCQGQHYWGLVFPFDVSSLRKLCIVCVSAVNIWSEVTHRRNAEFAEIRQRVETRTLPLLGNGSG